MAGKTNLLQHQEEVEYEYST